MKKTDNSFFDDIGKADREQSFHAAEYCGIGEYTGRKPAVMDTEEEPAAFIYGWIQVDKYQPVGMNNKKDSLAGSINIGTFEESLCLTSAGPK